MYTRRRNGQLSSCEPCRKTKLRCDHAYPVCGRCSQKGQGDRCFYHPAPMTGSKPPVIARKVSAADSLSRSASETTSSTSSSKKRKCQSSSLQKKVSTGLVQQYRVLPDGATASPAENSRSDPSIQQISRLGKRSRTEPKRPAVFSTGFLGPSSYWSAFEEHGESNRIIAPTPASSTEQTDTPVDPADDMELSSVHADQIESGVKILTLLDDLPLFQNLLRVRLECCRPWVFGEGLVFSVVTALFELRKTWVPHDNKYESQRDGLWKASRRIFVNTAGSISSHQKMTASEYFSVSSPRWETIALLFSWVGLTTTIIPDGHECLRLEDGTTIDIYALRLLAIEVAETCLDFCDKVGAMSDPLSWLLLQHTVLLIETFGDSDYRSWRKMGELSTVVLALGLHRPKSDDSSAPLFLLEVRRRVVAAALVLDKQFATVLGRPPRIPWQYCDIHMPLDLPYEDILAASDAQDEDAIMKRIGPDGWNIEEKFCSGTQARLYTIFAVMREKILALSLSPHQDDIARKISATCAEIDQLRSTLPATLQWRSGHQMIADPEEEDFLDNIHLEFLNNDFILYRVMVKKTCTHKDRLLKVAREMLGAMLTLVSRATTRSHSRFESVWNLCFIGLPCAGVLAQELLRRLHSSTSDAAPFPRSEVIQNLSVFASHLNASLNVQNGNHGIALKGLNAIRNVLDHVLSGEYVFVGPNNNGTGTHAAENNQDKHAPPPISMAEECEGGGNPHSTADRPDASGLASSTAVPGWFLDDVSGMEFMTWLDNLDWGQESLLSYS